MGEMADYALDQLFDNQDGQGFGKNPYRRQRIECRYCGEYDLVWRHVDGKWKLYSLPYDEDGEEELHICQQFSEKWWEPVHGIEHATFSKLFGTHKKG